MLEPFFQPCALGMDAPHGESRGDQIAVRIQDGINVVSGHWVLEDGVSVLVMKPVVILVAAGVELESRAVRLLDGYGKIHEGRALHRGRQSDGQEKKGRQTYEYGESLWWVVT